MNLPVIMGRTITRAEVIEGLRELYSLAVAGERAKDPTFRGWPDMRTILDHIEAHGLEGKEAERTSAVFGPQPEQLVNIA